MSKVVIVYHSGYGHTKRLAEAVLEGAKGAGADATLISVTDINDDAWATLEAADAIIFGAPTYMGGASADFKKSVTRDQWVAVSKNVNGGLGAFVSRDLDSADYEAGTVEVGAPPIQPSVVAQYDSSFANLKYALETVSFVKEADGNWRAAGYVIKPHP